jgi:hypothetical protein
MMSAVPDPLMRPTKSSAPVPPSVAPTAPAVPVDFCENCGETRQLAKIKGCIRCLRCGFKADCSGV